MTKDQIEDLRSVVEKAQQTRRLVGLSLRIHKLSRKISALAARLRKVERKVGSKRRRNGLTLVR